MAFQPKWTNPPIELYHGTDRSSARSILHTGVDPAKGRPNTDFGKGFYTTTWLEQAQEWAKLLAIQRGGQPAILELTLNRLALRDLKSLAFVRASDDAQDYWNFVEHCRNASGQQPITGEYYDVVYGPVAKRWGPDEYESINSFDQISFHTVDAAALLNNRSECRIEVLE